MTGAGQNLRFDLEWTRDAEGASATDASWGRLAVFTGKELFWGRRTGQGPTGFEWTWIDLLEHLAEVWPWLELEDGWPAGISPLAPGDFDSAVADRLTDLPRQRRVVEDQGFYEFRGRHDLSRCLQGAVAPPFWVVREGHEVWLGSDARDVRMDARDVLKKLEELGDRIAERISRLDDARAREACADWLGRHSIDAVRKLEIVTSLGSEALAEISNGEMTTWFEAQPAAFEPNEMMAAARMATAVVPRTVVRRIIDSIRRIPHDSALPLEDLTGRWRAEHRRLRRMESPAEEGYALATWLRAELALAPDQRAEPENLLRDWGVVVQEVRLGIDSVDAVAVWGPRHGPAVLINPDGRHAQDTKGRRATVAHEATHLLADRDGALPLAEVVGGHVPRSVEQRARAAAAELLIPRAVAGESFSKTADPETTLRELGQHYGASDELIAWQARNSDATFSEATLAFLRGKVSRPDRF